MHNEEIAHNQCKFPREPKHLSTTGRSEMNPTYLLGTTDASGARLPNFVHQIGGQICWTGWVQVGKWGYGAELLVSGFLAALAKGNPFS